ncbi:MAG: hypothetical protein RLZZ299_1098 [Pseudomonadota bacterium]|jgi:hypothetical protein
MVGILVALLACGGGQVPASVAPAGAPSAPTSPAGTTAPASGAPAEPSRGTGADVNGEHVEYTWLGAIKGVNIIGEWTSAACPAHGTGRNLNIVTGGRWYAVDLVSPCTPGTECFWSGLTATNGTWTKKDDALLLVQIAAGGKAPPIRLQSTPKGEIVDADTRCVYVRGVTVPPGYAQADVRALPPG